MDREGFAERRSGRADGWKPKWLEESLTDVDGRLGWMSGEQKGMATGR